MPPKLTKYGVPEARTRFGRWLDLWLQPAMYRVQEWVAGLDWWHRNKKSKCRRACRKWCRENPEYGWVWYHPSHDNPDNEDHAVVFRYGPNGERLYIEPQTGCPITLTEHELKTAGHFEPEGAA